LLQFLAADNGKPIDDDEYDDDDDDDDDDAVGDTILHNIQINF